MSKRSLFGWAALAAVTLPLIAWARAGGGENYVGSGPEGGGGGGGGGEGELFFWLLWLAIRHPTIGVPLLVVAGIVWVVRQKTSSPTARTQRAFQQREAELKTAVSARDVEGWVNTLRLRDPGFELLALLDKVKQLFLQVQEGWFKGELTAVRPFLSDATFQRLTAQLGLLRSQGLRDAMADVRVLDLQLIGLDQSEWYDSVHVRVRAQARDTDVPADRSDEQARSAARATPPETFTEVWTFVRKPGALTKIGADLYQGKCPSCGAPFRGGATNACEYCEAVVNSGNYDWTLSQITQGIEHVRHYTMVDGLLEARRRDPALNLEILEDRASLLFWRWIEAQSQGETKPLAKLASPAYLEVLGGELTRLHQRGRRKVFLECAVGAAITRQLHANADGMDEAHVEIRWSARMGVGPRDQKPPNLPSLPQRWVFTLVRRSGAQTPTQSGMSTHRCANCNAALTDSASPSCDYCGSLLCSGEREWVLLRASTFEAWNAFEQERYDASRAPRRLREGAEAIVDVAERERLLFMMAAMAAADGHVDAKERKLLELCATRWSVPWSRVELALADGASLFDRLVPKGSPEAEAFLEGLVRMALVDGRIDRRERQLLRSAATHLGIEERLPELLGQRR